MYHCMSQMVGRYLMNDVKNWSSATPPRSGWIGRVCWPVGMTTPISFGRTFRPWNASVASSTVTPEW